MTLFLITDTEAKVEISDISLDLDFQPTWSNLRAYQGYFHSNDPLLNRIWYSGAYTIQTNCVPVNAGRRVPFVHTGWANDGDLGPGDTIIVDGAKRDRAVWPGGQYILIQILHAPTTDSVQTWVLQLGLPSPALETYPV